VSNELNYWNLLCPDKAGYFSSELHLEVFWPVNFSWTH
jgi:hypothetical protein